MESFVVVFWKLLMIFCFGEFLWKNYVKFIGTECSVDCLIEHHDAEHDWKFGRFVLNLVTFSQQGAWKIGNNCFYGLIFELLQACKAFSYQKVG